MEQMRVFITGGAGFIGCNLAAHYLKQGHVVTLFDNLSRPRTELNLRWLQEQAGAAQLCFVRGDIRDYPFLLEAVTQAQPELIVHLAAQVAVTTSVKNPREDFEINALGTFNVLEAARAQPNPPAVFYASTNKVYGGMEDVATVLDGTRYRYRDLPHGVSEVQPLDLHSPYGCSKGAGDQYVRDYARIYGLRTVVFRQSCIYGERQFGVEDQGWVAHFIIAAAFNRPITIYGDGKQVRDLLHVQDLIAAYEAAWARLDQVSGQVFNLGGGAENALSIWAEFGPMLEMLAGRPIPVRYADWRPGDQPVFISNNRKAERLLNWRPRISAQEGIRRLWAWVTSNPELFH
ncbi:MAG: GDP-mannose 4,6-dehydratase [Thermoflexales bacterium]|nr:GDP-mannose 4,6-dehydratase [Thermoflexales bacterium]